MTDARTDPRVAALAAELHGMFCDDEHGLEVPGCEQDAGAILAALPADWCGHDRLIHDAVQLTIDQQNEIARLRNLLESSDWRIKKAEEAREVCHNEEVRLDGEIARLRAALEETKPLFLRYAAEIARLRAALDGLVAAVENSAHGGPTAYRPDLCRCGKFNCAIRSALLAAKEATE